MTQGRPKGACTGRLLGDQLTIVSQDETSLGMIVLMARCTASTSVVSPGAAWGGRRPSRQEAGHRGAGRRTLSKLASSMTYVTICQPPWRYTGTTKGMWSPTAMRPSVPPSERPAALRKCWSGWYSGSRLGPRPAWLRPPRGAAWTPARAARARVTGRRRRSRRDATRP
jgi:hypothetical protein